jgi:UDPglucose 6-dehydrogenase
MLTNEKQKEYFTQRILAHYGGDLTGKRLALWGASFKPRTDEIRSAPSLAIIQALQAAGAEVRVFDPVAGPKLAEILNGTVTIAPKMYAATNDADGLIIVTEWREFHNPDFDQLAATMRDKVIFDSRNLYDPKLLKNRGFRYYSLGRPAV